MDNAGPWKGASYPYPLSGKAEQAPGSAQFAAKPRLTEPEHNST